MSVAVLVNLCARLGSLEVGHMARRILPEARVAVTRSREEARHWIRDELLAKPPHLLLSGGGDGTAVGLLNDLRAVLAPTPTLGVLPLGTGNAWAYVTKAPKATKALQRIAALGGKMPPVRTFSLVETEGQVAPFIGAGWDAEILNDFRAQMRGRPRWLRRIREGLPGYLFGIIVRTVPRHLFDGDQLRVRLTNLGDDALTVDDRGHLVPVIGAKRGAVLYEGPASIAAAATTTHWGMGVCAFPFAHQAVGRVSVRIYAAGPLEALCRAPAIWRGLHPIPYMHDFFVTAGKMEFDRPVPFEIGGDPAGMRDAYEFRVLDQAVQLVDWAQIPPINHPVPSRGLRPRLTAG